MSQWTTPRVIPAATPASIAFPPAPRTRAAASEASAWPAATAQRVPMTWAVEVGVWAGAVCWELAESRLMAAIILVREPPAKGHRARLGVMNLPLIGVSTSITVGKDPERAYINAAYLNAVQQAGGVPVPLPPQLRPAARAELLKRLDGVLLTGGGDVDPARFGDPPHPTTAEVSAARRHPRRAGGRREQLPPPGDQSARTRTQGRGVGAGLDHRRRGARRRRSVRRRGPVAPGRAGRPRSRRSKPLRGAGRAGARGERLTSALRAR